MQLLKNNTKTTAPAEEFNEPAESEVGGLAASFTPEEVKKLFFSYLITILSIEGLIFFLCYVYLLATDSIAFPWKPYLFATFIAPVATTFIFGLILVVFNRFFFNESPPSYESLRSTTPGFGVGKGDRAATFFHVVHRLPILFSMFLLLVATAFAYKLEEIVLYVAQVGASTAQYLFYTFIGILIAGAIGIAIWMFLSYRIRQKSLHTGHEYRMQIMDQFGMVLLEDGTMINKEGEVVYQHQQKGSAKRGSTQIAHREVSGELPILEATPEEDEET